MKGMISSYWRSAATVSLRKTGPIVLLQETPNHNPTSKECNGLPRKAWGFSALHTLLFCLLMHPLIWNHASSVKGNRKIYRWSLNSFLQVTLRRPLKAADESPFENDMTCAGCAPLDSQLLGAFAKSRKVPIRGVRPVRLPVCINSAPTGWIFMKFILQTSVKIYRDSSSLVKIEQKY